MKKLLLPLCCAAMGALAAPAMAFPNADAPKRPDGPGPRPDGPGDRLKAMGEKLGLTDEQREKIRAIFEKYAPQFRDLMQDQSIAGDQKRAKMMELRKAEMEEVRAVLTPEQQDKMKDFRGEGRGNGPGEGPGDRLKMLTEKLGLTQEQQDKVRAIFENHAPELRAIMQDQTLTPDQKRAKMMELRKTEMDEVRAVLTPEQLEKMKDFRADGPGRPENRPDNGQPKPGRGDGPRRQAK